MSKKTKRANAQAFLVSSATSRSVGGPLHGQHKRRMVRAAATTVVGSGRPRRFWRSRRGGRASGSELKYKSHGHGHITSSFVTN